MSITSRCNGCGATSLGGVLSHMPSCPATKPPTMQGNIMPSTTITFDKPEDQLKFAKGLTGRVGTEVTGPVAAGLGRDGGVSNPPTEVEKADNEIDRILSHYDLFFVSEQAMNNGRGIAKAALTRNRDIYAARAVIRELEFEQTCAYLAKRSRRIAELKDRLGELEGTQDASRK